LNSNTILAEFKNKFRDLNFKQIDSDLYKTVYDWEEQGQCF